MLNISYKIVLQNSDLPNVELEFHSKVQIRFVVCLYLGITKMELLYDRSKNFTNYDKDMCEFHF